MDFSRENLTSSLQEQLDVLATFTESSKGITRLAFTEANWGARAYIKKKMESIGLLVREDSFGNLIGRLPGLHNDFPPIMSGSHIDSVPQGGNYDGVVGVLCALEVAKQLKGNSGKSTLQHPFEVIVFSNEEGSRFGAATLGSRALVGDLNQNDLDLYEDQNGQSLRSAIQSRGLDDRKIGQALYRDPLYAFIETHIEQGRILDTLEKEKGHQVFGIVTGIAAPSRYKLLIKGREDHSGATPMHMRRDALCGAAEIVLLVESEAKSLSADKNVPLVATIGTMKVVPGAMNVIPGEVELGIDIRSISLNVKNSFIGILKKKICKVCDSRNLLYEWHPVVEEKPAIMADSIVKALASSCELMGQEYILMPSGAGHDAMNMAKLVPTGMLFISCKNGISHNCEEFTKTEHIAKAVEVLYKTVCRLDR